MNERSAIAIENNYNNGNPNELTEKRFTVLLSLQTEKTAGAGCKEQSDEYYGIKLIFFQHLELTSRPDLSLCVFAFSFHIYGLFLIFVFI